MKRHWLLLVAFPFPAIFAGIAGSHQHKMEAARALFDRGVKSDCRVLDKKVERRSGRVGATVYYSVTLDRPSGPERRYVTGDEHDKVKPGDVTTWSEDRITGVGIAALELSYHENDFHFLIAVSLFVIAILLVGWWKGITNNRFPLGSLLAVPAVGFGALGLPAFLLGWDAVGWIVATHAALGCFVILVSRRFIKADAPGP